MFLHLLKYKFREIIRMKWVLGWTLAFPLVLSLAFYAGFGSYMKKQNRGERDPIPAALVSDNEAGAFSRTLDSAAGTLGFRIRRTDAEDAGRLLRTGKVKGIFFDCGGKDPELTVSENGLDQTVLSEFLRTYINDSAVTKEILEGKSKSFRSREEAEKEGEAISSEITGTDALKAAAFKKNPVQPDMQFFFSLLAMASLFASWMSTVFMKGIAASHSDQGLRFECSPARKFPAIVAAAISGTAVQFLCNVILVLFIQYGLGLPFGAPLPFVILVAALGGAAGIAIGLLIDSFTGGNEQLSIAVPLAFTMTASFLSGLMVSGIRQTIEVKAPFLNRINPAAVLSDALYTAGTYGITKRCRTDILILLVMTVVCTAAAAVRLSGRDYDHL